MGLHLLKSLPVLVVLASCSKGGGGRAPVPVLPPPPEPVVCTHTLQWVNPTEDVEGRLLDVDELTAATIYMFSIPMAEPEEATMQIGTDPYLLTYQHRVDPGLWYYRMTVSNEQGESEHSNEVSKECS